MVSVSVIIPFYKGNQYINRLIKSIEKVVDLTKESVVYEVIIINDSPEYEVSLPKTDLDVKIIKNKSNMGTHGARVTGLRSVLYGQHGGNVVGATRVSG